MTDRVYPSSKPTTTTTTAAATATTPGATATTKPQLRQPYRPQPQYGNYHRRKSHRRNHCCCCCFWTILILLALGLLAAIAGAAFYVLYRPQRPQFSISSLRIAKLNLTTDSSSSTSHLNSLLNITLSSKNPNSHIVFFYDSFTLSVLSNSNSVQLANGSIPSFVSDKNNETNFRSVLTISRDLDTESVTALRSDLKRKTGVPMKVQMDTKVKVKMGNLKSKKVGIRVTCQGIRGVAPKSKSPSVASVSDAKCEVDLRIKIWKWTF